MDEIMDRDLIREESIHVQTEVRQVVVAVKLGDAVYEFIAP